MGPLARRRDERGVTAVLVAVLMSAVLVVSAAFAVDLGQQRVVRRDMQAIADVVALDLARHLNEGPASSYNTDEIEDAKNASVARNDGALGGKLASSDVTWEFVRWDGSKWETVGKNSGGVPEAIRVRAESDTAFAFGGVTGIERGSAARTAVASSSDPSVCVSVGTKTLTLDTSGSVLAPLLEDMLNLLDVDLDVIGYDGIVALKNVHIPLLDVLVELNVGSSSELLGTNASLADLTLAMAHVAQQQGNTAAAGVLEAISLAVPAVSVPLGELIAVEAGQDLAGLGANINALDLLGASVFAATGEHALEASLPGYLTLTVIEPPQIACGKGNGTVTARSAQIKLGIDIPNLLQAADNLGIARPSLLVSGQARLELNVGYATARIDEIECGPGRVLLQVDTGAASLATVAPHIVIGITATSFLDAALPLVGTLVKPVLSLLVGSNPVGLRITAGANVASSYKSRWIPYPEAPALPAPVTFPEPDSERKTLTLYQTGVEITGGGIVGVLAGALNPVVAALTGGVVTPLLNTTLTPLLDGLISPILGSLGIGLGVAEVSVGDRPVCNNIKLVG